MAALDVHYRLGVAGLVCGAYAHLDVLGGPLADEQVVLLLDVVDYRGIELIAGYPYGTRGNDAAQGDYGDLAGAAADIHDHAADRLGNRETRADSGSHRLLDDGNALCARVLSRFLNGAALYLGNSGRNADDDARLAPAAQSLLDELLQHA